LSLSALLSTLKPLSQPENYSRQRIKQTVKIQVYEAIACAAINENNQPLNSL